MIASGIASGLAPGAAGPGTGAPSRALPIAASVLFVLFIAGAGWVSTALVARMDLVQHTLSVENSLSDLLSALQDAETGQRGYLLTGNEDYLAPYDRANATIAGRLDRVAAMTADNPVQQLSLPELRAAVGAKLAELQQTVERRRAGDAAGALAVVQTNRGRDLMMQAREVIGRMKDEETRLLGVRSSAAAWLSRALFAALSAGALVALAFVGFWLQGTSRHARALEQARHDLSAANAQLEDKVAARTAELLETNEEVQRFAYIVSHDLRAPLVNIMGFTSELETTRQDVAAALVDDPRSAPIDRDFAEALGFIQAAISKMDGLIGAILKISREGRRGFRPERLDLTALVQGLADAQRHQADAAGAVVTVGRLPSITADRLAVEQVFSNLIDNAIKYLDPARPGRIDLDGADQGGDCVFQVRDNGRGIAPADHARVFELFRRAGAQDKQGEGIGLAHVRTLVRSMGGRIELASVPGVGTTFVVALPKAPPLV